MIMFGSITEPQANRGRRSKTDAAFQSSTASAARVFIDAPFQVRESHLYAFALVPRLLKASVPASAANAVRFQLLTGAC
jgi:hypothetical protein